MCVFVRGWAWMAGHQSPSSPQTAAYQLIWSGSVIGGNGWGVAAIGASDPPLAPN